MSKGTYEDLLTKARELVPAADTSFIRLGAVLWALDDTVASRSDFREAIESLGIGYRKARYLVEVSRAFQSVKAPEWFLQQLGWTKCSLLAPYITPQNSKELLEKAASSTALELKSYLDTKEQSGMKVFSVPLTVGQRAKLDAALEARGAKQHGRHVLGRAEALMRLIDDADHAV